jgi:hypothetical protein
VADQTDALVGGDALADDIDRAVGRAVVADQDLLAEAHRLGLDGGDLAQHLADGALLLVGRDEDG